MAVVDIGLDLLHRLGESGVFFHLLFYLLERVEHRRVIPIVKDLADLHHRQIGHAANEVHGDLAGSHGILDPLLTADDLFFDPVILADVVQDVGRRGNRCV